MKKKSPATTTYYAALLILIIIILILIIIPAPKSKIPSENGTIEACFSKSQDCKEGLEETVSKADHIKAALYDLNEPDLLALLKKKEAGVDVLIDEDNYDDFGKKIISPGLMHNKFWLLYNVSGKDYVVSGSTNPTVNDFYKNDNNMVIIRSNLLMQNYEAEFEELKNSEEGKETIYKKIIFNGKLLENYFCPEDGCEEEVVRLLSGSKRSVYFMIFSFTSDPIGDILISMKDRIEVKGVFDESQLLSQKRYTEYYKMKDAGMNVRIDGNSAKLHHKVFIIDNETVITGSYNPTAGGDEKNDENIMVIRDEAVLRDFVKEFYRVFSQGKI